MADIVRFGSFEVDLSNRQLRKRGLKINLRGQSFEVLAALLERQGELVTRTELQRRLWPDDVFVEFENNLNTAVARLREALCDSPDHPLFIETVPRRGYRFLARLLQGPAWPLQPPPHRVRLVVLPFVNMRGNGAEDYFSDAITDEIITALASQAPERLAVIARTTAMRYKRRPKDVAQVGRELDVDYVLEGGVRRDVNRVVINAQLIQTSDQVHVFARRYEADTEQVFGIQTKIAEEVARHIPNVSGHIVSGASRKQPSSDPLAYQLYLQGRQHMYKETPQELIAARQCFEKAIARDPRFALAYDALGECHYWTGFFGHLPPKEAFSTGLWAALRALEIDNTLAETHGLLAQFRQQVDYDWFEVRRELDRAIELDPLSPLVHFRYAGSGLLPHGQLQEGIAHLEYALTLDPLSQLLRCWLSVFLWLAREYEHALRAARSFEELYPDLYIGQMMIAHICRDMGSMQEAISAGRRAAEWSGGAPQMLGWLGFSLALIGESAEARLLLRRLHELAHQHYVSPSCFAFIHLGLGEIDDAFRWMERAIEDRDPIMVPIKSYPFLDPLRQDPRFEALLRKMNLEQPLGHFHSSFPHAPFPTISENWDFTKAEPK